MSVADLLNQRRKGWLTAWRRTASEGMCGCTPAELRKVARSAAGLDKRAVLPKHASTPGNLRVDAAPVDLVLTVYGGNVHESYTAKRRRRVSLGLLLTICLALVAANLSVGGSNAAGAQQPASGSDAGADGDLSLAPAAVPPTCSITPGGLIGDEWKRTAYRPGCPLGPEEPHPTVGSARQQRFEHGTVVWSPDQKAVVAFWQNGAALEASWTIYEQYTYQHWSLGYYAPGSPDIRSEFRGATSPTSGSYGFRTEGAGTYSFQLRGCDKAEDGACKENWTAPAQVHWTFPPVSSPCPSKPDGLIGLRWSELQAEGQLLGCPVGPPAQVPSSRSVIQRFERGLMATAPDQGPGLVVAMFRQGSYFTLDWNSTAPFKYNLFQVQWWFNGTEMLSKPSRVQGGQSGRYTIGALGEGNYAMSAEGCDRGGALSGLNCKQGPMLRLAMDWAFDIKPDPRCRFSIGGFIGNRWTELGGAEGLLGCPTGTETVRSDGSGSAQTFERGQLVWSPRQGPALVVAVWNAYGELFADFGPTTPYTYGHFQFAIKQENGPPDDPRRKTLIGTIGGRVHYVVGDARNEEDRQGPATFSFAIRGCDGDDVDDTDNSECKQGWSVPAVTDAQPRPLVNIGDARVATPDYAASTQLARGLTAIEELACSTYLDPRKVEIDEDATAVMYARLARAARSANPATDFCPDEPLRTPNVVLVNDLLTRAVRGTNGTAFDGDVLGERIRIRGDYDMAVKNLVRIAYHHKNLLSPEVYDRLVLSLITPDGGHNPQDEVWAEIGVIGNDVEIPESENHILMMASSRYLGNQLKYDWFKQRGATDAELAPYDNRRNGGTTPTNNMTDWLVAHLSQFVRHDFLEYNARPYQRMSLSALLNLYDFARDPQVREAAKAVLDYTTTKFALSSNNLRRYAPIRRLQEHADENDFYSNNADFQTPLFFLYSGLSDLPGGLVNSNWEQEMVLAATSSYRPPGQAIAWAMDKTVPYELRIFHGYRPARMGTAEQATPGVEVYSSSPSFLLTGGGLWLPSGYGGDQWISKNVGVPVATSLIPTKANLKRSELIRFEPDLGDQPKYPKRDDFRYPDPEIIRDFSGTCVAVGFACGPQPQIPGVWRSDHCVAVSGSDWQIFDASRQGCFVETGLGLYVAVWTSSKFEDDNFNTVNKSIGMIAAVESSSMPFETFKARILANSFPQSPDPDAEYTFKHPNGHTIVFNIDPTGNKFLSRIRSVDGKPLPAETSKWPLAAGPLSSTAFGAGGHDGLLAVAYPRCAGDNADLMIDYRDIRNPRVYEVTNSDAIYQGGPTGGVSRTTLEGCYPKPALDPLHRLLFYRNRDDLQAVGALNNLAGKYQMDSAADNRGHWTHVAGVTSGPLGSPSCLCMVLSYRSTDGAAQVADVSEGGNAIKWTGNVGAGWSHVVEANGRLLFFDGSGSRAATASVAPDGTLTMGATVSVSVNGGPLVPDADLVVPMYGGWVLVYDSQTGAAGVILVDHGTGVLGFERSDPMRPGYSGGAWLGTNAHLVMYNAQTGMADSFPLAYSTGKLRLPELVSKDIGRYWDRLVPLYGDMLAVHFGDRRGGNARVFSHASGPLEQVGKGFDLMPGWSNLTSWRTWP